MDAQEANGVASHKPNQGWTQVTNPRKQRRNEVKEQKKQRPPGGGAAAALPNGVKTSVAKNLRDIDLSGFAAVDEEAHKRRARMAEEAAAAAAESNDEEEDEEEGEAGGRKAATGGDAGALAEEGPKKPKKPKKPKVTVADAAAGLDVANLSTFLSEISESFAGVPDVQLMRCTDYFARAFSGVTAAHFSWPKLLREMPLAKLLEVPLCYLPEDVIATASDWLGERPQEAVGKCALTLLRAVLEDVPPGGAKAPSRGAASAAPPPKAKVGALVVLAMAARKWPEVLLQHADGLRADPPFAGQDKLGTLAWLYGQAAAGDLVVGMALWVKNLLPLATGKQSNPLTRDVALSFMEGVILKQLKKARPVLLNGAARKGERLVPPSALDAVLHAAYPPTAAAHTKATERFVAILPFVKEVALAGGSKTTKGAALQLLPLSLHTAAEEPEVLSENACENFEWALAQNGDCYKQWEKHHLEQLKGSTAVLAFMARRWPEARARLAPLDDFRRTLKSLRKKHREALEAAKGDAAQEKAVRRADTLCKVLLRKAAGWGACAKAALTVGAGVAIAYGLFLLSPDNNPWNWDGLILLSKTHNFTSF